MSLLDTLKGAASAALSQAEQQGLSNILSSATGSQVLQSITAKLDQAGLGDQVRSWTDPTRTNAPISADQIRNALGDEHVRQLATSMGLPIDKLLSALSQHLPQTVGDATAQPGSAN